MARQFIINAKTQTAIALIKCKQLVLQVATKFIIPPHMQKTFENRTPLQVL